MADTRRSADLPEPSPRPTPPIPLHAVDAKRPRAIAALRLSCLTSTTRSPSRQRSTIGLAAEQLGLTLVAEAADLGVSAHRTSPFERTGLSPWLRRPDQYEAIVWARVDRAVRSTEHMTGVDRLGAPAGQDARLRCSGKRSPPCRDG
ncbi:recombinase family protein [Streptomyces ossamyceticus]|uniref:Recombinase family protein n=1 Tax=Streptomyces ossamyceticus TaxID=249581 RepID=A0ABV2V3V5_9ACTN